VRLSRCVIAVADDRTLGVSDVRSGATAASEFCRTSFPLPLGFGELGETRSPAHSGLSGSGEDAVDGRRTFMPHRSADLEAFGVGCLVPDRHEVTRPCRVGCHSHSRRCWPFVHEPRRGSPRGRRAARCRPG
jgi:hypothetical protein